MEDVVDDGMLPVLTPEMEAFVEQMDRDEPGWWERLIQEGPGMAGGFGGV